MGEVKMRNLTYPTRDLFSDNESFVDEGEALASMDDYERSSLAEQLISLLPHGALPSRAEMPLGVHPESRYFGPVRFIKSYFVRTDSYLGRMDLNYAECAASVEPEDFVSSRFQMASA